MFKSPAYLVLPLALAAAGLGAGSSPAAAKAPVTCDIRITETGGTRELSAVVMAASAITGSYQFDLSSVSAAGNADTSQGDDMTAAAGETILSTTSVSPGGKFNAKLTVTWAGGSASCAKKG